MTYKIYSSGKEVSDKNQLALFRDESIGVFETMRAYQGKIFKLEDLERLLESAKTVGYKVPSDRDGSPQREPSLKEVVESALKDSGEKNTSVRLTLWEGKTFVIIGSRECPPEFYEKGVVLKTASFPRGNPNAVPYPAKASAYQQAVMASTEPNPGKAYEWLFLDQGNYLTETRVGNFFIVKKGKATELLTSPEHLILNGVTRRFVIKCALELGFFVEETPLTRHDFFNAAEAFLTNTSWEILPVRELDGRAIGKKVPGPITMKLHRLFTAKIRRAS